MTNEIMISIGGGVYVFEQTKFEDVSEVCDNCALRKECVRDDDTITLCDCLGIARMSRHNFRKLTDEELQQRQQNVGTATDDGMAAIPQDLFRKLQRLGIIPNEVRSMNVGASDYSRHLIQPWAIWQDYDLNPWDADIVKRVLRHKATDTRRMDYEKIIHICRERIRQLDSE